MAATGKTKNFVRKLAGQLGIDVSEVKGFIRRLANHAGLEVSRFSSARSDRARLAQILSSQGVTLVFDVGANVGQYGRELRNLGYRGRIVSFEPVSSAHLRLQKKAAHDPRWVVAPRTAIGNDEGTISMHVAASSIFSSALPRAGLLRRMDLGSGTSHEEQAPLATLNALAPQYLKPGDLAYLKIDVQGFEHEVLHGADKILDGLCGVQLEVSLIPLYQGEKPFRFMLDFMERQGFELHSLASVFVDETTGREIQMDAIFIRGGGAQRAAHMPTGARESAGTTQRP
jgi:FkbM family methyltransferase